MRFSLPYRLSKSPQSSFLSCLGAEVVLFCLSRCESPLLRDFPREMLVPALFDSPFCVRLAELFLGAVCSRCSALPLCNCWRMSENTLRSLIQIVEDYNTVPQGNMENANEQNKMTIALSLQCGHESRPSEAVRMYPFSATSLYLLPQHSH